MGSIAASSADAIGAELVAIEVAKVREMHVGAALTGGPLIGATQHQSLRVDRVYLGRRIAAERDHGAVSERRGFPVMRAEYHEAGIAILAVYAAARRMLEQGSHPCHSEQRVIEGLGLLQRVRTHGAITQGGHYLSPYRRSGACYPDGIRQCNSLAAPRTLTDIRLRGCRPSSPRASATRPEN